MDNTKLTDFLQLNGIQYEKDVELSKKTWIHRGGKANFYILPSDVESLEKVCSYLYTNDLPFLLVGHTSNLYIHNDVNLDIVVSTVHCNAFSIQGEVVECECGAAVSKVAKACVNNGLQGLEFLTVLPGTVGAALVNNSSCRDSSISSLMTEVVFLNSNGERSILKPSDFSFEFRSSKLKKKQLIGTILIIKLSLKKGDTEKLQQTANENEERRRQKLEGPTQNLGCTVNRTFSKGHMPTVYAIPLKIYTELISLFGSSVSRQKRIKRFILTISGFKDLIPYISDKQMITFIWRDENADQLFPRYLDFMRRVYMTDHVEIEEIK